MTPIQFKRPATVLRHTVPLRPYRYQFLGLYLASSDPIYARHTSSVIACRSLYPWAAQPGVWGTMPPPHFWDQRGTGGTGKMIFSSMFINASSRQQISIYSIGDTDTTDICLLVPHIRKSGGTKIYFRSLRSRILFSTPHLRIRGAAHAYIAKKLRRSVAETQGS